MKQKEKKNNQEAYIATLEEENKSLRQENLSLKRQLGGYKGIVERTKRGLEHSLGKAIDYGKEADEIIESKIAAIDERDKEIEQLRNSLGDLQRKFDKVARLADDFRMERDDIRERYDHYVNLPWYRRVLHDK